jgi:GTP-binding protein Era
MMEQALRAMEEVDVVVLVVDASRDRGREEDVVLVERIRTVRAPVVLVLNKVDLVEKPSLLPRIAAWHEALSPAAVVPISALRGEGLDGLLREIVSRLPVGPAWFPRDQVSDLPERFLAAELVREQLFLRLQQELPYQLAVEVEEWTERPGGKGVRILARIWVARDGQKAIVIGKGGAALKQVGTGARLEIERMLGTKVFLELSVGVEPDWTRRAGLVNRLGHFGEGGAR